MALVSRYSILACICIVLIACVGSATAAIIPQVCAQCSSATYPGSDICPRACIIAFPADTEWTYPEEIAANEKEVEEEATMNNPLISRFMGAGEESAMDNSLMSRFMRTDWVVDIPNLQEAWDSRFVER